MTTTYPAQTSGPVRCEQCGQVCQTVLRVGNDPQDFDFSSECCHAETISLQEEYDAADGNCAAALVEVQRLQRALGEAWEAYIRFCQIRDGISRQMTR